MPTTLHPSLASQTPHLSRQPGAAGGQGGAEPMRASGGTRQLGSLAAPMARAVAQIDAALAAILTTTPGSQDEPALLALQAALLRDAHLSLVAFVWRDGPHAQERVDAIVAESLLEAAEAGLQLVGDLEAGGLARLERCWSGCRQWATELGLLGGDAAPFRDSIRQAKAKLVQAPGKIGEAEAEVAALFGSLAAALGARRDGSSRCLLDRLLFPGAGSYMR